MFEKLARLVSDYPRWVLAAWFLLLLLALPYATRINEVLTAQTSGAPGSIADKVSSTLSREFINQDSYSLVLASRSEQARAGEAAFDGPYRQVSEQIAGLPGVQSIQDYRNSNAFPLIAEDGRLLISLVGLKANGLGEAKEAVNQIQDILRQTPTLDFNLSGGPATILEIEKLSERDARRAELFGLPLSLIVLLIAFGALIASGLPLLVAVTSIILSFAALFFLGQIMEFAVFTQSIVTMLGLATGIDYALLMVNRFREEIRQNPDARAAAATTAITAGRAVAFSGFTVMIALGALLVPPLSLIRSIGIGTMVVLLISVLVSITALPASLALLGKHINSIKLTRREPGQRSRPFWKRRAEIVMRRPWLYAIGGTLFLLILSLPALDMQVADPGAKGLSQSTDAYQVELALEELGLTGILRSFDILIDFGERPGGFFYPSSVREVSKLTSALTEFDQIEGVYSPTTANGVPRLLLFQYYASRETATQSELIELVDATVSQNDRYALVRAFPFGDTSPRQAARLERQIREAVSELGLNAQIGGGYIGESEWNRALYRNLPLAVLLVYLATFILLGLAFRSFLIPIKSIILNTLTVSAAFGIITLIFQYGVGASLFGLAGGLGFVDNSVPIFIFAIVFGLSMDYEVFLVARIYEAHERGLSDRDAVTEALSVTGGVISSAATVMVVVFSLFIFSEVVLVKTLGLGLGIAISLDATLVRLALVPAVMSLAGRWNWWLPKPVDRLAKRIGLSHD